MLEVFLLMVSAAVQSSGAASTGTESVAVQAAEPPAEVTQDSAATAPQAKAPQTTAPQATAPAAEQPAPQTDAIASADPSAGSSAAIAPVFLAPKTTQPQTRLVAEPQVATGRFLTALEVKPILNATKGAWISVREYGGQDLLYVTHLWAWRCGLLEMRVGLNGAPAEIWPLPDCHEDLPSAAAILATDGLPYREFPLRSVQIIEVQLTYDDLSTDSVRFNRAGVVIP